MHHTTQPNAFRPVNNALSSDSILSSELILLPLGPGRHAITLARRDQPVRDIGGTPFPCALISVLPGPGRASFPAGQTAWLLSPGDTQTVHVQALGAILTLVTLRPSGYAATGLHFTITDLDRQPQATAAEPAWNRPPPFEVAMAERRQPSPVQPFAAQPAFGQSSPATMPFGAGAQPSGAFPPGAHPWERDALSADLGFAAPPGAFPDALPHGHRPDSPGSSHAASPARFQPFRAAVPDFGQPEHFPGAPDVPAHPAAAPVSLHACAHIQNIGDVASLPGQTIGSPGSRLRLEAVAFKPEGMDPASLEYATISHEGLLSPWVSFPRFSGTRGVGLPILGFVARLTGEAGRLYDVAYAGTFQKTGQSRNCRNGEFLFSNAEGDALESLAVRILPKA